MKQAVWVLLLAVLAWFQGADRPAWAEDPSTPLQLHLTLSRRPAFVHPTPDPKIAEKDADEAIAEIKARERGEELSRETLRPSRRPDLSYDVWSGIQSRNINDALRRR